MSIESVMARVNEIEARLESLWPEVSPAPPLQPWQTPGAEGRSSGTAISVHPALPAVKPFDVALGQALGQVQVRPVSSRPLSPEIEALITKYSGQYGLAPNVVRAVIIAESDGNPRCVSHKGAMGLMQLMPDEVRAYNITDPFDPEQNIAGGTRQLAEKLRLFNGDLKLALAAYNAGSGAVRKYGGVPPYPETQNYIRKIFDLLSLQRE